MKQPQTAWCTCSKQHPCSYLRGICNLMLRVRSYETFGLKEFDARQVRIKLLAMLFCAHRVRVYGKSKLSYHTFAYANRELFENLSREIGESYYD